MLELLPHYKNVGEEFLHSIMIADEILEMKHSSMKYYHNFLFFFSKGKPTPTFWGRDGAIHFESRTYEHLIELHCNAQSYESVELGKFAAI